MNDSDWNAWFGYEGPENKRAYINLDANVVLTASEARALADTLLTMAEEIEPAEVLLVEELPVVSPLQVPGWTTIQRMWKFIA